MLLYFNLKANFIFTACFKKFITLNYSYFSKFS